MIGNWQAIRYCERFLELMIDLVSQLPTRRFFHAVLQDSQLIARCKLSKLTAGHPQGKLFNQLLEMLRFFEGFEINDYTGNALTDEDMNAQHSAKLQNLQV